MAKGRFGPHSIFAKHRTRLVEVNDIPVLQLQKRITHRGTVNLHQLHETDECLMTDHEWPKKSGVIWYCCVATGLLFDKQTGQCRQSTLVNLDLSTVEPFYPGPEFFKKWRSERQEKEIFGGMKQLTQEELEDAAMER